MEIGHRAIRQKQWVSEEKRDGENVKAKRKVAMHLYMQDRKIKYLRRSVKRITQLTYRGISKTTQPIIYCHASVPYDCTECI